MAWHIWATTASVFKKLTSSLPSAPSLLLSSQTRIESRLLISVVVVWRNVLSLAEASHAGHGCMCE